MWYRLHLLFLVGRLNHTVRVSIVLDFFFVHFITSSENSVTVMLISVCRNHVVIYPVHDACKMKKVRIYFFYHCPEHNSCHRMIQQICAFCVTELPWLVQ